MKNIELKKFRSLKKELDALDDGETLYLTQDGDKKYVVIPYSSIEAMIGETNLEEMSSPLLSSNINIISPENIELSFDEYEMVKQQIIEAFDRTFKPNPEKLN